MEWNKQRGRIGYRDELHLKTPKLHSKPLEKSCIYFESIPRHLLCVTSVPARRLHYLELDYLNAAHQTEQNILALSVSKMKTPGSCMNQKDEKTYIFSEDQTKEGKHQ